MRDEDEEEAKVGRKRPPQLTEQELNDIQWEEAEEDEEDAGLQDKDAKTAQKATLAHAPFTLEISLSRTAAALKTKENEIIFETINFLLFFLR
jgi:hypothetical protein